MVQKSVFVTVPTFRCLHLNDGTYKPYRKPNDETLYVHAKSNHPPNIIKQIPISIENHPQWGYSFAFYIHSGVTLLHSTSTVGLLFCILHPQWGYSFAFYIHSGVTLLHSTSTVGLLFCILHPQWGYSFAFYIHSGVTLLHSTSTVGLLFWMFCFIEVLYLQT